MTAPGLGGPRFLVHTPIFTFVTGLLDSHHFSSEHREKFKVLEIGCGNGEFAVLLKKKYNEKIDITAIDPSETAIQFAIDNYSSYSVTYKKATVEDFGEEHDGTFDFIMFSKSLHHCEDIKQTLKRTHALLKSKGLLFAEEFYQHDVEKRTTTWLSDRIDLIKASGLFTQAAGDYVEEARVAEMLDISRSGHDRWYIYFSEKNHAMPQRGVIDAAIAEVFGSEPQIVRNLPFLHNVFISMGLDESPAGSRTLATFMAQEDRAIRDNVIEGVGINFVADKL